MVDGCNPHCVLMMHFLLAPVTVQFAQPLSLTTDENVSPLTFELILSGPVSLPFDVEVCTRDGSATG